MLRRIAAELKDCPALLGYDILNEPVIPDGSWDTINRYFRQAVQAVRQEDPHHLIFLEGDFFAMNFSRVSLFPYTFIRASGKAAFSIFHA